MSRAYRALMTAGVITSALWLAADHTAIRKKRMHAKLEHEVMAKFIGYEKSPINKKLADGIESCLKRGSFGTSGVKVLWGPTGAGKTLTVREVLRDLYEKGEIAGAMVVTPDSNPEVRPIEWFRAAFTDVRGTLLDRHQLPSEVLPEGSVPYVIVIDQAESVSPDGALEMLLRALAHDSSCYQNYVVLLITSDAAAAATICGWCSWLKTASVISPDKAASYKWGEEECAEFVQMFNRGRSADQQLLPGTAKHAAVVALGVKAGTPAFLRVHLPDLADGRLDPQDADRIARYYGDAWTQGAAVLKDTFEAPALKWKALKDKVKLSVTVSLSVLTGLCLPCHSKPSLNGTEKRLESLAAGQLKKITGKS
jgi:hypothetical protein